ncbi:MAG: NAD(P)-binding domain-containing protein, partial [Cyanobium sp.]
MTAPQPSWPSIAFLGLGALGLPMAQRLLAAEVPLRAWNRSPGRLEGLRASGACITGDPADAVTGAALICLCLSDDAAVRSVLHLASPALAPGSLVIDFS